MLCIGCVNKGWRLTGFCSCNFSQTAGAHRVPVYLDARGREPHSGVRQCAPRLVRPCSILACIFRAATISCCDMYSSRHLSISFCTCVRRRASACDVNLTVGLQLQTYQLYIFPVHFPMLDAHGLFRLHAGVLLRVRRVRRAVPTSNLARLADDLPAGVVKFTACRFTVDSDTPLSP
eukprot:COSAG01_NODE_296_length_19281_cov_212.029507_14_plen_177_part_00